MLTVEKSDKTGTFFIDAITSRLSPSKDTLLSMLANFEEGTYGNYDLSDLCYNIMQDLKQKCRFSLGLDEECPVKIIYYDDHDFDLQEYHVTIEWMVYELFLCADVNSILRSEATFIREFLNTPLGKEKEAVEKWNKYWESVDFEARQNVAPM